MAKKQTRRSISVSRVTYERLKAFCEANNISMSQLVETRVNDFLGDQPAVPVAPRPMVQPSIGGAPMMTSTMGLPPQRPSSPMMSSVAPAPQRLAPITPMTSAAARIAVEPPPPIIKPKQQEPAPKPTEKRPDQIFTF